VIKINKLSILNNEWNVLFEKITLTKIDYIKKHCKVCSNKNLISYKECNHLDYRLMVNYVNRKLKHDSKEILNKHLNLIKL